MDILLSLNPKQKESVTVMRGPVLVIAGPGSGKTRCLTHRIAYLISQNILPNNILAVTFTNKAAQEMRERVNELIKFKPYDSLPNIGTFHSICLQILRHHIDKLGYKRNFVIYDSNDQISLIKQTFKNLQINLEQFKPEIVQKTISQAKDEMITWQNYQEQAKEYFPKTVSKIYQAYQESLKKANALDFDDLIMLTVQLFENNPNILEKYQNQWQYILIDEAHDTNSSQYALTNLLAKKNQNIWLIADPDQNIYSWRGADFRNVLNFEKDYPKTKVILLEQNYRSTKNIIEASHSIITKNIERKDKTLWTNNSDGSLINVIETSNQESEGNFIIEEIQELVRQGYNLNDFTVLYRANAQSRAIE